MQYKIRAWAVDNRPVQPKDFDPEKDDKPEGGFRNDSGKKKIRQESPPFDDPKDAAESLAKLLGSLNKETRLNYHTIQIQGIGDDDGEDSSLPTP